MIIIFTFQGLKKISSGKLPHQPEIYNFANEGKISWYDFAVAILELSGSNTPVHPIPAIDYQLPAHRPANSLFCLDKIKSDYPFLVLPEWTAVGEPLKKSLLEYVSAGGVLLASGAASAALFGSEAGVRLLGAEPAVVLNVPDQLYCYEQPDERRRDPFDPAFPFEWVVRGG